MKGSGKLFEIGQSIILLELVKKYALIVKILIIGMVKEDLTKISNKYKIIHINLKEKING